VRVELRVPAALLHHRAIALHKNRFPTEIIRARETQLTA
jgi:hypothetical protein